MGVVIDERLFGLARDFLTIYLPKQKSCSENTIKAYREVLNLLFGYIKRENGFALSEITFETITSQTILGFLDWLKSSRGCSVSTRNHRLSCICSFYKYAGNMDMTVTAYISDIQKVPVKKLPVSQLIKYFSENTLKVILAQPDTNTLKGIRNLFYMVLLYDTGARNQEILDLKVSDIHVSDKNPYVLVTGKGRKTRIVPVMQKTVEHYNRYVNLFHDGKVIEDPLFYVARKGVKHKMSDDNVSKFIKAYGASAKATSNDVPENLHPHMFRHARAIHLYRGGMPLTLISEWLGHAQLETTLIYAYADTNMKREAIDKATSKSNPLVNSNVKPVWQDDETIIKRLYGLM